ncbi:FadR family transcriptional regulator [Acuticoccus sp. M5D2P5]|uniref:FadR/GntR family transcriptional regulator n=1 Tax=Acuticoccus kalidii TaxID=2910977 RepID=UPI001F173A04|nr:FadR/GntR family transcriptional regulator [Acuticoccus kalidii]MCF3935183.1 FadR family transcriptional regulator [Acuticoccus kalidii]
MFDAESSRAGSGNAAADRPLAEASRAGHVYDDLMRAIADGAYADGRLPAEATLARSYAVSRPVVREALARLREDGIVASRRGSGSYVVRRPSPAVFSVVPIGSISDIQRCYEFRIDVEGAAAGWAAKRRTEADLAALRATHARMDAEAAAGELGADADAALHRAITEAAHNPFFSGVLASLAAQIAFGMNLSRSLSMRHHGARIELVQAEHAAIIDAITRGDAEAATAAMRHHIGAAQERMFEGVPR